MEAIHRFHFKARTDEEELDSGVYQLSTSANLVHYSVVSPLP